MTLTEWATKHNVSALALHELSSTVFYSPPLLHDLSESGVQSRVRLEGARKGDVRLWRNNVGAGKLENGQFIRWGLANESKGVNELVKSADLIGYRIRVITLADVGRKIAQFLSREIKRSNWTYSGTDEEEAQMRWAVLVNNDGGDAAIVTGEGSL